MELSYPDAVSWARARSRGESPRLGMLEAYACQSHPEVVRTFGSDGAALADLLQKRPPGSAEKLTTALFGAIVLAAFFAPIVGLAVIGSVWQPWSPDRGEYLFTVDEAIPVAVASFLIGGLTLAGVVAFLLRKKERLGTVVALCGFTAATMAGLTSLGMPRRAEVEGYVLDAVMMVPVWATGVLGAVTGVITVLHRRAGRDSEVLQPPEPAPGPGGRRGAERAALTIPDAQRWAMRQDRDAAVRVLAERGLLDADLMERALEAPLGGLYTLDP